MAAAAAEASRSGAPSADSYIGSLIGLTSKSEIRYEGVLFNINTEESSIGLRNVRSFGTEGRKKDGQQISPSDKIYEYILFRGSDIKDLQVKSSPSAQTAPSVPNDPAIIQSHYTRPVAPAPSSATLPSGGNSTITELSSHIGQVGPPRSTFQGGLPLYQPGGSLGTWGSSPPSMFWQGYYAPTGGMPHLQQPPLLRPPGPPPGLPITQTMQQTPGTLPSGAHSSPGANGSFPTGSPSLPRSGISPSTSALPGSHLPLSCGMSTLFGISAPLPSISSSLPGISVPHLSGSTNFSSISSSLPGISVPQISGSTNIFGSSTSVTSTAHLPELPLLPPLGGSITSAFSNSVQATDLPPDAPGALLSNKPISWPVTSPDASSAFLSRIGITSDVESIAAPASVKSKGTLSSDLTYQSTAQPVLSVTGSSSSSPSETTVPSLLTPGQILQPESSSTQSTWPQQAEQTAPEAKLMTGEHQNQAANENNIPILPLPTASDQKQHGALHTHHSSRGRGRGRGNAFSCNVTKFTEDFDFIAMNEKFNKDEVWGHLCKSRSQVRDQEEIIDEYDIDDVPEDYPEPSTVSVKPVYVKDNFFDSLSCNTLDHRERNGRLKFSEQRRIDTETFGDFRHRLGRGGGRGFRGGGRARGFYHGRGYGYVGRGRGHALSNWAT